MDSQHQKKDELINPLSDSEDELIDPLFDSEDELIDPLSDSIQSGRTEPAGPPHEAFSLVLAYLHVLELLVMSESCTSLRDAVAKDVLPWLDIQVYEPLSSRITDETLLRVASMAGGRMRSLALMDCSKVTDDGLLRVIESNPFITKLHLPGCDGLTSDGIIRAVKTVAEKGSSLESLQIRDIPAIKKQHLEMLSDYVRMNPEEGTSSFRPIDVEVCPKCDEVRMVFDCTREACQKQHQQLIAPCRGCEFCVMRCKECGGCVGTDGDELEETLCADALCLECWLRLPKCNFCNKPYCSWHAIGQGGDCSSGFVCEICKLFDQKFRF